jgi:outer membrane protein OmpA-like peptidoglycan-associated protein
MRRFSLPILGAFLSVLLASQGLAEEKFAVSAERSLSASLGVFGGGRFFAEGTNLGVTSAPEASSGAHSNLAAGLRAALGVGPWFAVEAEILGLATTDRTYQRDARILGYRLNALAYVLPGDLRPFVLIGAGAMQVVATQAVDGAGLVRDTDGEFHVGAGIDYALTDLFSVRADVRVVEMPGKQRWALATDAEATMGLAIGFGAGRRASARAEAASASPLPATESASPPAPSPARSAPLPPVTAPPAPVTAPSVPAAATPPAPVVEAPSVPAAVKALLPPVVETPKPEPATGSTPTGRVFKMRELLSRAREIRFEGRTSKLGLSSLPLIGELAEALVREPGFQIEIVSHTGGSGDAKKDLALSKRRAVAVKNALVEREVPAAQIVATGRGSEEPLAPNITQSGRQRNDRVELRRANSEE